MNLLTQNQKLKDTSKAMGKKVFNFSIPAYKSNTGKVICPFAESCIKFCYAQKGNYKRFPIVGQQMEKRYKISKGANFIDLMNDEIKKKKADFIRIHDSGDFYSKSYIQKWFTIANDNPKVKFYAYTKSFILFQGLTIPDNLDIIFSEGGKHDNLINTKIDRHARIFNNKQELIKQGYIDASKNDLLATKFFNTSNKVGLIFH